MSINAHIWYYGILKCLLHPFRHTFAKRIKTGIATRGSIYNAKFFEEDEKETCLFLFERLGQSFSIDQRFNHFLHSLL